MRGVKPWAFAKSTPRSLFRRRAPDDAALATWSRLLRKSSSFVRNGFKVFAATFRIELVNADRH